MKLINKKAEELQVGLGFIEILMIAGIIVNLLRLYQDCKKSEKEIHENIQNLSFVEKAILRREIKKAVGRDKYMEYRDIIEDEIIKKAKTLAPDEIKEMLEELPVE